MKLLITGARGQLGREVCRQLECGQSALGPLPEQLRQAKVVPVDIEDANLANLEEARGLVRGCAPDIVINCAAFTNVDAAETEPDAAFAANAIAPRNMAMACEEAGAKLVHISTDYVYGASTPRRAPNGAPLPFTEAQAPVPACVYGTTKLAGEGYVRGFCSRWFIVRTAWLYGRQGSNFVKTMLRLFDEKTELSVVNDQFGCPTNAEDLAWHLLKIACTEEYGLYHCSGAGVCSWYDFALEILRLSGKSINLRPCATAEYPRPAARPPYSALERAMLRATACDKMRSWQEALADYMRELCAAGTDK